MIPYLLSAIGGYLIGESQKKDSVEQYKEGGYMADGGDVANGSKLSDKEVLKFAKQYKTEYAGRVLGFPSNWDKSKNGNPIIYFSYFEEGHGIDYSGRFMVASGVFENNTIVNATNVSDALFENEFDALRYAYTFSTDENFDPDYLEEKMKLAKGGKVKSKKWIQEALTGDEGSLRRTAKRKGLLRGDENLSMTDLKKLQKMGGKTAKRAHLAETLRKFDDGGMMVNDDLRKAIYDMDEDEFLNFCAEYELDSDDSNEVENFVYDVGNRDAKKMIEDIKAGNYK